MELPTYRLSLDSIHAAAGIIDPVFLSTPQYKSDSLSELLGLDFVVKVETLNPVRCFKGRGADLLVAKADQGEEIICASAGNFGQAMAYSCRKRVIPLTVLCRDKGKLL